MERFTVEEFQENFDLLIDRVEKGESFIITSQHGDAVMIPYNRYEEIDDLTRIYKDHEEGC